MVYGLLAALGFGLADFLTAIAARRMGAFVTLLVAQLTGMALLAGSIALGHPSIGGAGARALTWMILGGVAAGFGYLCLYRALELGPIALVSPIVAADAAFGVILFVVFRHEVLTGPAAVAVVITIVGVLLASADPRALDPGGVRSKGIPFALASLVLFTLGLFVAGSYAKRFGWFLPMFTSRIGTMVVVAGWLAGSSAKDLRRKLPGRFLALAAVIGIADLGGFALFTRGSQMGLASIVTAASAAFPLIPIAGGMLVFGERPAPSQLAGAGLVIGGMVVLGLASR